MNDQTEIKENFQLKRLPKGAFEILVTIPREETKKTTDSAVAEAAKTVEVKGFRKGKVPEKMVIEAIGKKKLLEMVLQRMIPDYYQKAISLFGLKPIVSPRIELVSVKEDEDWQIKFSSCEEPEISLGNYKEELSKKKKAGEIWTPEKGGSGKQEKKPEDDKDEKINAAIDWLLGNAKVEICDLLIDEEVSRKLSGLIEQTQKLGLSVDQYLASTGKTPESIREEYANQSRAAISLELILGKIADEEKIEVQPEEIEKILASAKTEEEKKALEEQRYYLATILRRQKTLDFLASLV